MYLSTCLQGRCRKFVIHPKWSAWTLKSTFTTAWPPWSRGRWQVFCLTKLGFPPQKKSQMPQLIEWLAHFDCGKIEPVYQRPEVANWLIMSPKREKGGPSRWRDKKAFNPLSMKGLHFESHSHHTKTTRRPGLNNNITGNKFLFTLPKKVK